LLPAASTFVSAVVSEEFSAFDEFSEQLSTFLIVNLSTFGVVGKSKLSS
jgi:hypothetical protein